MALPHVRSDAARLRAHVAVLALVLATAVVAGGAAISSTPVAASTLSPTARSWCTAHGSFLLGWTGTKPNLPICGPGPNYGGTWSYVDLPGPHGTMNAYYNATPGFQCVELAERYLAVADGMAPLHADGASVAAVYAAAHRGARLVVNASKGSIGHPPVGGDVISFAFDPSFDNWGDGHVAIVARSAVNFRTGNGTVTIAQQNVSSSQVVRHLDLVHWRLVDPAEPADPEYQFPYAEWLQIPHRIVAPSSRARHHRVVTRSHERGHHHGHGATRRHRLSKRHRHAHRRPSIIATSDTLANLAPGLGA